MIVRIKTILIGILFAQCFNDTAAQVMTTREYIDAFKYAAMQEMKVYNIPASITLGQGILESASGNSKLATGCNNHFGIKCRKEWTGAYCLADDDAPNECFRGYASAMESYRDHSIFLKQGKRYESLFSLASTDYKGWANGLKNAGYATNPAYANTLIGVIERYRLGMYDSMVLLGEDYYSPDTAAQRVIKVHGIPAVYAKSGQTQKDIAKEHEMGTWQIRRYNDLDRGQVLDPGEIVYLKPKKRKGPVESVVVRQGQDMREISQEQGMKMKQLYKKNKLKPGQQVKPGEVLYLRSKAEKAPQTIDPSNVADSIAQPKNVKVVEKTPYNPNFHEVRPGETLYSIAAERGVTVENLILWNNLDGSGIKAGQILILKHSLHSSQNDSVASGKTEVKRATTFHIVLAGETLYGISKLYNQPIDSIKVWNKLNGNALSKGQELRVASPFGSASGNSGSNAEIPNTYTVQPGDTLYSIARKFGITVAELKKLNGLVSDNLSKGQTLQLK